MPKPTRIKEVTHRQGKTLRWLAGRMKPRITPEYLGRLASGDAPLDEARAQQIVGILKCNLSDIAPWVSGGKKKGVAATDTN